MLDVLLVSSFALICALTVIRFKLVGEFRHGRARYILDTYKIVGGEKDGELDMVQLEPLIDEFEAQSLTDMFWKLNKWTYKSFYG